MIAAFPSPAPAASAITARADRLADLPVAPLLNLLPLIPKAGQLTLSPGPQEGRVLVEVAGPYLCAQLEVEGDAEAPLALPQSVLTQLKRRHGDAATLVADLLPDGAIGWRSFSESATVALRHERLEPSDPLPALPTAVTVPPAAAPIAFDPALLGQALAVAQRLTARVELLPLWNHGGMGLVIELLASSMQTTTGRIAVARCAPPKTKPQELAHFAANLDTEDT